MQHTWAFGAYIFGISVNVNANATFRGISILDDIARRHLKLLKNSHDPIRDGKKEQVLYRLRY
jgi:hypothetical protein